ncbi:hypothetical protein HYX02_03640 [Candidatus Woesearchaeota archaeon]|nr:hypothetical protein [Candidatus Woesearchaeota archaeon]
MVSLLSIVIVVVAGYFLVMFILHHLFEKFFKMIFYIGTILFALGLIYYVLRGA